MTPVISSSIANASLIPQTTFITRNNKCLTRSRLLGRSIKQTLPLQRFLLPLSTSVRLFPRYYTGCEAHPRSKFYVFSATGTEVAVEEANIPTEVSDSPSETSEESSIKSNVIPSAIKSKRTRPAWKSDMPPVKNEELIVGATFNGKVKSIQPFGAFVDFGAFTDGLVHVSQLSDGFVKDVGTFVTVGQEVKVRLVEANTETGRISLTMREKSDDTSRPQQQNDGSPRSDQSRPPRGNTSRPNQKREGMKKATKFVKGQDLEGTVKNLVRAGAFITLPDDEEGFLPTSEESNDGFESLMGGTSMQIGQEVSVRVLRIARGQVTLTMKKEEANAELDAQLNQGVIHVATNPFLLAFRQNKDISAFLDEKEKKEATEDPVLPTTSEISGVPEKTTETTEDVVTAPSLSNDKEEETEIISDTLAPEKTLSTENPKIEDFEAKDAVEIKTEADSSEIADEISSENLTVNEVKEIQADEISSENLTVNKVEEIQADEISSENLTVGEVKEIQADDTIPNAETLTPSDLPALVGTILEEIGGNEVSAELVEKQVDNSIIKDEPDLQTLTSENGSSTPQENVQTVTASPKESETKAISPALVKQLREETGAGMMDCKNALSESEGDIVKALEFLRKKGLASADKKSIRATSEGRIASYIHDSRIGILIEVNCETDFVSRGNIFKELVDDLAMQAAAYPQVQYLVTDDVPEDIVSKERDIEMQKEDLLSKPEQIRSKIVDGRIRKRLEDLALLEQPYIKNDKVAVKDWVKQTIATIGENIKVKRFVRFNLGEGLEKKSQDFAAEVAAQTTAKAVSAAPVIGQPVAVEATETVEKPPTVAVSAAVVKQLRDETGAGMMDCKKALSETGGDLEKAQDYLRKKGLSTADKKSSRIAAEGRIGSYIHDSRIGVLIEVNCETDFVGRSEKFKELVDDLAMQVVACPQVRFVSIEDIPESSIKQEKEMEMQREDLLSKPENIRERIVEGRISKRLGELALLEQPFIKDDSVLVKDLVKQTVAALGENIKVRRFVRFTLGEEIVNQETKSEA